MPGPMPVRAVQTGAVNCPSTRRKPCRRGRAVWVAFLPALALGLGGACPGAGGSRRLRAGTGANPQHL
eukprot:6481570-Amphidinium_carterae.1